MKYLIIALLLFICCHTGKSQDKVIILNGDTIRCQILEFNGIALTYKLSSPDSVYYMSGTKIYQLLYSNGEIQNVSNRVMISGKKDWEKVILTSDTADIEGLVKVGDLKTKTYAAHDVEQARDEGQIKLRKEAAELGAFIVLITDQYSRKALPLGRPQYYNVKSVFKATAYTYKNNISPLNK
jgi:hypothetical protein